MIVSLLYLVLIARALVRSFSSRFVFGIVVGLMRVVLMVAALVVCLQHGVMIMLPGLTLRSTDSSAVAGSALYAIAGPVLTFALVFASWRRFQNVPAAQEEMLQRPFAAWLPVGILDAIYVAIAIAAAVIAE
jgi:hypothetical protein